MRKLVCVSLVCILFGFTAYAQEMGHPEISEEQSNVLAKSVIETEEFQKEMKSKLSTLWTVVTLNMITADVLSLYIPESMDEWEELADGREAELMLGGAIMYQIPISMVILSKVLPHKVNRWTNIVAAGMMTIAVVAGGSTDPHYIALAGAEVVWMSMIAWNAWKWPSPEEKYIKHNLGLNLDYSKKAFGLSYNHKF